jgi:hypothetical protein
MIWKGVSADPPVEDIGWIRILPDGTEVEHPVVLSMSVFQELLSVLSAITIEALYSGRRIPHDDNMVGDIHEILVASSAL